jgi:hypothetical protein
LNKPARVSAPRINELLAFTVFGTLQLGFSQKALTSHDVQNEYSFVFVSVKDSAGRFNDLTVARSFKLGRNRSQAWMLLKFVDVSKNTPHEYSCRGWILNCDVVGDGFEIR